MVRSLAELIDVDDPAAPEVEGWIEDSPLEVRVLRTEKARREACLYELQVTTRSVLGAFAYEFGGLVVDHGWLRLLGGGHEALPSLSEAVAMGDPTRATTAPDYVVLGWDVVGGVFALDGGGLKGTRGNVCYFAPDTLQWEDLELGHAAFVQWVLGGGLDVFSGDLRWEGWTHEVADVPLDEVYRSDPPLWTPEGQEVDAADRHRVPVDELLAHHAEMAARLAEG